MKANSNTACNISQQELIAPLLHSHSPFPLRNHRTTMPPLLLLLLLSQLVSSQQFDSWAVKSLPGFHAQLPFPMETGYVGVGESEEVQTFYYFVKSEGSPRKDPLMLWLTGGVGCSSLSGLVYEIGPINFKVVEYNGSLPTLVSNPYSWTKVASIIFPDMPVGTGFSYADTPAACKTGDFLEVHRAYQFLRKWLMGHPEFLSNPVFIGGDSYSGITVPPLVELISTGNEEGLKPFINLKGYILGNPVTDPTIEENSKIPFAHGMGLISDELYEALKRSCRGKYQTVNQTNKECLKHIQDFDKCTARVEHSHILEPSCAFAAPRPKEIPGKRRYLDAHHPESIDFEQALPTIGCRTYGYLLSKYWANDKNVRAALHVREGTRREWQRCYTSPSYIYDIRSSTSKKYHARLGAKGYRRLIYSGDHDMMVPFLGTQEWIRSLNYSIVDDWRPWYLHGQVAGYTRTFTNRLTFATIKGGGHTAPEYRPAESYAMFKRWILEEPL